MTITASTPGALQIRTKNGLISLGDQVKVGDFALDGPGEYEIGGVEIFGVGRLYIFEIEEMRLAYLDKLNRPLIDLEQEAASDVDILLLPVGGGDVLDAKGALSIISQLDPRIVIPMYYDDLTEFSKEEGVTPEHLDSLKISKINLPETERKVIVLPWKPLPKSST